MEETAPCTPRMPTITRCWRAGCTLKMINGFDHPGLCNVVLNQDHSSRRAPPKPATFSLLNALPSDCLAHVVRFLRPAETCALEQLSHGCRNTVKSQEQLMWLHQLEAMLPDGDPVGMTIDAMPGCCCRTIFRCL